MKIRNSIVQNSQMKKAPILFICNLLISLIISAQNAPFELFIEPVNIKNLGGLQSFAFGQSDGKWLIIGGRLDGLHRRQPFASFDTVGNNKQLIVVDPLLETTWSAPLDVLPVSIKEHLSSTNMQFQQDGNYLYLIGGYGYNKSTNKKKTFENLTAIHVPQVIDAIVNGGNYSPFVRQITDSLFAVTGGHLKKFYTTYYLLGGNRFDGNYNPMGNPTFTQKYTDAIRPFKLIENGNTLVVNHLAPIIDSTQLHRRDYNAVPQIFPNGQEGTTLFSGVFRRDANLPYLNCVNVDSSGYEVNNSFQQYYNHYHCAVLPLYSSLDNEMHSVFFGGIAQYFDSLGVLVQDNNVPFVKTIARVTRNADGNMAEYKLPVEMPGLLGAGSEFIPDMSLPMFANEVLKLDDFTTDTTMVGYIYGGINSSAPNIFFLNNGTQSESSNQIFKVFVVRKKKTSGGFDQLNEQSIGTLKMQIYPNPNDGNYTIRFNLKEVVKTKISVYTISGSKVEEKIVNNMVLGENIYQVKSRKIEQPGSYIITIETPYEKATQMIVVR